jgi:hypothetical protein
MREKRSGIEIFWRRALVVLMAGTFLVAGIMKISAPAAFTQDILRYRILSETAGTFFAAGLPWLEITIALALLWRPFRLSASFVMVCLMTLFTLAVASALARGLDVACGCFGKAFVEYAGSGATFLLRDGTLLAASVVLFLLVARKETARKKDCGHAGPP